MPSIRSATFSSLLLSLCIAVSARPCATFLPPGQVYAAEDHFFEHRVFVERGAVASAPIGVHFHVFSRDDTYQGGSVPDEQITDQLPLLNDAFAPAGISFELRSINHVRNQTLFEQAGGSGSTGTELAWNLKSTHHKGDAATLNVYTIGFEKGLGAGASGVSNQPWEISRVGLEQDGILLSFKTLPNGDRAGPQNQGAELIHQVGHWTGLYHTNQALYVYCDAGDSGDYVSDTPIVGSNKDGACPTEVLDTCPDSPGVDLIHNFMDSYSDDTCVDSLTPLQYERVREQLATYRGVEFA